MLVDKFIINVKEETLKHVWNKFGISLEDGFMY